MSTEIKLPPMPEPDGAVELECGKAPGGGVEVMWVDGFTASSLTAYATEAARMAYRQGLEDAASRVDSLVLEHPGQADLTAIQCARAIRALAEKG